MIAEIPSKRGGTHHHVSPCSSTWWNSCWSDAAHDERRATWSFNFRKFVTIWVDFDLIHGFIHFLKGVLGGHLLPSLELLSDHTHMHRPDLFRPWFAELPSTWWLSCPRQKWEHIGNLWLHSRKKLLSAFAILDQCQQRTCAWINRDYLASTRVQNFDKCSGNDSWTLSSKPPRLQLRNLHLGWPTGDSTHGTMSTREHGEDRSGYGRWKLGAVCMWGCAVNPEWQLSNSFENIFAWNRLVGWM